MFAACVQIFSTVYEEPHDAHTVSEHTQNSCKTKAVQQKCHSRSNSILTKNNLGIRPKKRSKL